MLFYRMVRSSSSSSDRWLTIWQAEGNPGSLIKLDKTRPSPSALPGSTFIFQFCFALRLGITHVKRNEKNGLVLIKKKRKRGKFLELLTCCRWRQYITGINQKIKISFFFWFWSQKRYRGTRTSLLALFSWYSTDDDKSLLRQRKCC